VLTFPEHQEGAVVLPDGEEIILIDPSQGEMTQLLAGDHDAIGSDC